MKIRIEWICPKCGAVAVWVDVEGTFTVKCPICGKPMEQEKAKDLCSNTKAMCCLCQEC